MAEAAQTFVRAREAVRAVRRAARACVRDVAREVSLLRLRGAAGSDELPAPALGRSLRVVDRENFAVSYRDIVERRIYDFTAARPDPRIVDGGGNIGLAVLRWKQLYPAARVVTFEPDPPVHACLAANVGHLPGVEVVRAALSGRAGASLPFDCDGKYGSTLVVGGGPPPPGWTRVEVPCRRLRDALDQPTDLLKLNIEGAEWEVLDDARARLGDVREVIIEYHHLPGLPRTLHLILGLLHEAGFEYLVNDLDEATNPAVEPPFRLGPDTRYFLLVYARRTR